MVNYKQFRFIKFASPAYRNVSSDVKGWKRGELVMVAATKSGEKRAARRLRPGQKLNSLLPKLMSRFSQPVNRVVDMPAGTFLTAEECFTVPRHRVFAGCEADPSRLVVAKGAVVGRFSKTFLGTETDLQLSRGAAETAVKVSFLVPEMGTANRLWSPPNCLLQYKYIIRDRLFFLGLL